MRVETKLRWILAAGCAGWALACGGDVLDDASPPAADASGPGVSLSPDANPDLVATLRESAARTKHASDGGGRAWLDQAEGDADFAVAGTPGRFTLVFEVGSEGIATDGVIFFQVSPFWGWTTPQPDYADAPGYTVVRPDADDVELEVATLDQQLLGLRVTGRPLVAGERIRIVYGAGPLGAMADRVAERNSRFWFAVDGNGDGFRAFIEDSPGIDVRAGRPAQLVVTLPSVARVGEKMRVTVAILDALGSAGFPYTGEVAFAGAAPALEMPETLTFTAADAGHRVMEATAVAEGVVRLVAASGDFEAVSNPLIVGDGPRVFWGDLHGHTALTDGTGTVEDYFRYARDVAGLDVASLTDHDHWGILPLDSHPEMWDEIQTVTRRFNEPGRFVTILGYEWTSWLQGHRHVLYFADEGEIYSSLDPAYETPQQLWAALRGRDALTFAHHSAGGPIATNWQIPPDPVLEPLTEIVSVHGSSEAPDSPVPIYDAQAGNWVRDALDRGYRFGFVGSGDSHDGHPGLAHLGAPTGGLAAILAESLTREGVLAALRARRVYASNGARIVLRTALGEYPMGATIPTPDSGGYSGELFIQVHAVAPLERVDFVRSGSVVDSIALSGELSVTLQRPVEGLRSGEYVYVRVVQADGGAAWSSPIYVD